MDPQSRTQHGSVVHSHDEQEDPGGSSSHAHGSTEISASVLQCSPGLYGLEDAPLLRRVGLDWQGQHILVEGIQHLANDGAVYKPGHDTESELAPQEGTFDHQADFEDGAPSEAEGAGHRVKWLLRHI